MEVAPFSPAHSMPKFRMPAFPFMLLPLQAIAAFFMPVQHEQVTYRTAVRSSLPQVSNKQRVNVQAIRIGNKHTINRLKVVREFDPGIERSRAGRMVISGRIADVCAELDRIALQESA